MYDDDLIALADDPHHFGHVDQASITEAEVNRGCGDQVTVEIAQDAATGKITEIKWHGEGCVITRASMSLVMDKYLTDNLSLEQLQALSIEEISQLLGVEQLSPGRWKCALIGKQALVKALAKSEKI
jgi:nitrogen fixation protein NifU and related proteins